MNEGLMPTDLPRDSAFQRMLIPYGIDRWTMPVNGERRVSFPVADIGPAIASPLRFNTLAYDEGVMAAARGRAPIEAVRRYLARLCAPWDQAARAFLDRYFEGLDETLKGRTRKGRSIATFDGLFQLQDWLFSAPVPLPRAHLPASDGEKGTTKGPDDHVAVDFAFWLGRQGVAVVRPAATPRQTAARDTRLRNAGIVVVEWNASLLTDASASFIERLFAPLPADFWLDQRLPCGPFRPAALRG